MSALLAGLAALWFVHVRTALTAPSDCPGLLELIFVKGAQLWPNAQLATGFFLTNVVAGVVSAGALSVIIKRLSGSTLVAAAIGISFAAAPILRPTLGPPVSVVVALSMLAFAALLKTRHPIYRPETLATSAIDIGGWCALVLLSLCAPAIAPTLVVVVLGAAYATRRRSRSWWAPPLLLSAAWALSYIVKPPELSWTGPAISCAPRSFTLLIPDEFGASALLIGLMALGVFQLAGTLTRETFAGALLWMFLTAVIAFSGWRDARNVAPLVAGMWIAAGAGLGALVRSLDNMSRAPLRIGAQVAMVSAVVLVVLSPRFPGSIDARVQRPRPLGHEQLTANNFHNLLGELPLNAAIVREDALSDILIRALSDKWRRAKVGFVVVAANDDAVREAAATHEVFALPVAQSMLSAQGFEIVDTRRTADRGIAEIKPAGACDLPDHMWHSTNVFANARHIALFAGDTRADGPVVLWLSGSIAIDATPDEWPGFTTRGFHRRVFDRTDPVDRRDLADALVTEQVPVPDEQAAVTRLELWRTPDAPNTLRISLTASPTHAVLRVAPDGRAGLRVCAAFPSVVHPINVR